MATGVTSMAWETSKEIDMEMLQYIPKSGNVLECIEWKEREIEISDKSVVFAYQQFLAGKIE